MTISYDRSIWGAVQEHTWKWRRRNYAITGIIWHATRGNQGYSEGTELSAALNWFRSPNNRIAYAGGDYAGISNYVIGNGECVEVVPGEQYLAAWSSWPSDEHALSVEVTQSNYRQEISTPTILRCVRFAIEAAQAYNFPLTRVFPSNDWTWTGMTGHADTVQGKLQRKSDPDDKFWVPFLKALEDEVGGDMLEEVRKRLDGLEARVGRIERILLTNGGITVKATPDNVMILQRAGVPSPQVGRDYTLTGETLLAFLDMMEMNLYLGHQHLQKDVADIKKKLGL